MRQQEWAPGQGLRAHAVRAPGASDHDTSTPGPVPIAACTPAQGRSGASAMVRAQATARPVTEHGLSPQLPTQYQLDAHARAYMLAFRYMMRLCTCTYMYTYVACRSIGHFRSGAQPTHWPSWVTVAVSPSGLQVSCTGEASRGLGSARHLPCMDDGSLVRLTGMLGGVFR